MPILNSSAFHYREYRCRRPDLIDLMIKHYPLALICSEHHGQRHASHIPLFRATDRTLFGHVDRSNPQFQQRSFQASLIFMGLQRYIPPEAYLSRLLPTWNYVAVHMDAEVEVLNDIEFALDVLRDTCDQLQPPHAPFQYDAEDPRVIANVTNILALRVSTSHEEGRFKLSQDKGEADRAAAFNHLLRHDEVSERKLLQALMDSQCQ
ncbi:FMN-binding negative transcriptional regulator [Verminephrobacter eiseniae]|uniref:FMN-binding negative transcriptional regulator n=1 Tax=Verminephrobacter eiseniae TaxID=364317 RepID=UPI00223857E9|nr:FMN-binding negative transcriptional regulator [Verminephrobacter eiseniae]MCW5263382.1 FMN-binding negative transcriptional regulator [Verminephrobacter eiseniae]